MKTIVLMLIYLGTFMGMFFLLSCIGMLWQSYVSVISDRSWFVAYSMFLGWWISLFPAGEYYNANKRYFAQTF